MDTTRMRAFFDFDDLETEVMDGDVERVVYTGAHIQLIEYRFPPSRRFAVHEHAREEQMGYLVQGRLTLVVGDEERVLEPGDFYHVPVGVPHGAWTTDEPAVLIDVFAPPRDDILAHSNVWIERTGAESGT